MTKPSNTSSENSNVARAAGIVSAATMISRVTGLVRDTVIAAFFGAGWITDAFWVAYRIPNLLRRFLAEGALTISFVPIFTQYLETKGRKDALDLAYNDRGRARVCFGDRLFPGDCLADRTGF